MPARSAPFLVRRPIAPRPRPRWDSAGQRALDNPGGFLRVLGGPGTGKTTLLAEVAADRMRGRGVDPENLLVLTANRKAALTLRARITSLLTEPASSPTDGDGAEATLNRTVREPLVRTVHSYAFAVLRLQAVLGGMAPPRLLAGPEQDAVVRELLAGDIDSGAEYWPARLRPALGLPAFAAELRDLLLRAAERGLGPEDLMRLGSEHGYQQWVAAGRFGLQYEQVTLLRGMAGTGAPQATAPALDAAELVSSALLAFHGDPELLATEQARVRCLLVDDAQHLDPHQYELVRLLGDAAAEFIIAGDPDQTVFSFRGADSRALSEADPQWQRTTVLNVDHRMAPAVRAAVTRLTARLPGAGRQRALVAPETCSQGRCGEGGGETDSGPDEPAVLRQGSVQVRLLASAAAEASWVADQLRRAHLLDGVAWSDMAVLVRSTARSLPVLRRAMLAAAVPVAIPVDELPLAQQSAVRPLLTLLRHTEHGLDEQSAAALLESPLAGADPLALRRLRRGLRRLEVAAGGDRSSGELLVDVLEDGDKLAALDEAVVAPVRRVGELLRAARRSVREGAGVEQVLWQAWQASGLEQRWRAKAARSGPVGAQADRDLDAVVALFDAAARYADRLPGRSAAGFVEYLVAQRIVGDSLAPAAPQGEAVAVLTAHAAAGREWSVVAVPGVQEGTWPDLRLRGSLLGVERLVDLLSGVDANDMVSATAPLLAEERRLLLVAASRARHTLLVSAVRGEDDQPSRFLDELDGATTDPDAVARPVFAPRRGLVLADLVGELRRVVCDAAASPARRRRAATQLARLAAAGVPGAHPDSWYGLPEVSTDRPLWTRDQVVSVSPSTVEVLTACPLRWLIERNGGQDAAELASITGTLVHALVQAAASGADAEGLRRTLDDAWAAVDAGAPWFSRRERKRVEGMLDAFLAWLAHSRAELTQVAVERDVSVDVPAGPDDQRLRVRGRVDRLELDTQGRPVVIDVKTSRNPVSKEAAAEHPQLAVYQLAAALGVFAEFAAAREPGGARLLYVSKEDKETGAAERVQPPLDADAVAQWLEVVRAAANASTGPTFTAVESSECPRCPARTSCPLQPPGRQVGG